MSCRVENIKIQVSGWNPQGVETYGWDHGEVGNQMSNPITQFVNAGPTLMCTYIDLSIHRIRGLGDRIECLPDPRLTTE